jgi:hypothetical protein
MNKWIFAGAGAALLYGGSILALEGEKGQKTVMPQLRVLWLETNGCTPQLSEELQENGYTLAASSKNSEGILHVDVHQLDANTGASARFSAKLNDKAGKSIWQTTGREDSISQEELCEDIGEEVAERLKKRMEAIG